VRFLNVDFMRINLACASSYCICYAHFLYSHKGMSGCMERIAIAMQDGGTGAGAQHGGTSREANLIFVLPPNVYVGPPVGGTFWFQIFIQAPSPEIWSKTVSGDEEVLAGKWGGLFLGYLFGEIFGGVIAIISFRLGGWMQQSAVPRCAILSVGSTGVTSSEAARVHHAARRRGGMAACGARSNRRRR
jgi:hypothetical protein